MMAHPLALQLRNLQTLIELGVDKNTTVVFPAPLMSAIGELGDFLARETAAVAAMSSPLPIPPQLRPLRLHRPLPPSCARLPSPPQRIPTTPNTLPAGRITLAMPGRSAAGRRVRRTGSQSSALARRSSPRSQLGAGASMEATRRNLGGTENRNSAKRLPRPARDLMDPNHAEPAACRQPVNICPLNWIGCVAAKHCRRCCWRAAGSRPATCLNIGAWETGRAPAVSV